MQKMFNRWLVASDIDGTLNSKLRTLPPKNKLAIEKFIAAGGYFTLASGRPIASLERAWKTVKTNCPTVCLNGSLIYDFSTQNPISRHTVGADGKDFVSLVLDKYGKAPYFVNIGIFGLDKVYIVNKGPLALGQMFFDQTPYIITDIGSVPHGDWFKVIFWAMPPVIEKIKAEATSAAEVGNFMASSPFSFEMLAPKVHKGSAVMELADMLGIDREHTAAIGDYFNDWDMLKTVGFPACAGQAPKAIHEICKYEACHCNKGCVADLLGHIMTGKAI